MGQQRTVHGLLADKVHALARQEVQAVAVALVIGHGVFVLRGAEAHHRLEQVALTLLDVLAHGVQVGGKLHTGGEQALVLLALALAVQLLPPLGHKAEAGLIGRQQLDLLPGAVQLIPGAGILPGGIGVHVRQGTFAHHIRRTGHQRVDIDAGHSNGQQTHGREHTVPSADVVRHHELLVALIVGQALQGPLAGVGGGIDAPGGLLRAVLLLQQLTEKAEGHGGLRGGAGLGDNVHGEVHAVHQLHHLGQRVGAEAVADKVDVGRILLFQVVIGRAQAFDDAPGTQVGAADTDDHQRLGVGLYFLRRRLDAGKFRLVIVLRPVNSPPAPSPFCRWSWAIRRRGDSAAS